MPQVSLLRQSDFPLAPHDVTMLVTLDDDNGEETPGIISVMNYDPPTHTYYSRDPLTWQFDDDFTMRMVRLYFPEWDNVSFLTVRTTEEYFIEAGCTIQLGEKLLTIPAELLGTYLTFLNVDHSFVIQELDL